MQWLIKISQVVRNHNLTLYLENYTLIRRHQILKNSNITNSISLTKQKPEPGLQDATCKGKTWLSYKERRVDALALRADERRDKLR